MVPFPFALDHLKSNVNVNIDDTDDDNDDDNEDDNEEEKAAAAFAAAADGNDRTRCRDIRDKPWRRVTSWRNGSSSFSVLLHKRMNARLCLSHECRC